MSNNSIPESRDDSWGAVKECEEDTRGEMEVGVAVVECVCELEWEYARGDRDRLSCANCECERVDAWECECVSVGEWEHADGDTLCRGGELSCACVCVWVGGWVVQTHLGPLRRSMPAKKQPHTHTKFSNNQKQKKKLVELLNRCP